MYTTHEADLELGNGKVTDMPGATAPRKNIERVLEEIKIRLIPEGIEKLILFGSYARGTPTADSDIDLLIVASSEALPSGFSEKHQIYRRMAHAIRDIKRQIPVDLLIHTKAMHRRFIEMNSLFYRELMATGKTLYDKNAQSGSLVTTASGWNGLGRYPVASRDDRPVGRFVH